MSTINKTRLAFFGSSSSFISSIIYKALLKELKNRDDIELVVTVDAVKDGYKNRIMRQDFFTTLLRWLVLRLQGHKFKWRYYGAIKGTKIKDINSAECYRLLNLNHVDAILSVACPQIFGDVLLGYYYCVNYHNSILPMYKGVCSTQWEQYFNEHEKGFTFHRIVKSVDSGNILCQRQSPFLDNLFSFHTIKNEYEKILILDEFKADWSSIVFGDLFRYIIKRDNGQEQCDADSSYYDSKDLKYLEFNEETLKCFGWTAFPWYYVPKFARRWVK